jgi:hypothetical protein
VRICITKEQAGLEEEQATGPDGGAAPKPGQDVTPNYRLHLKQKEGAEKDRDRKENMIRWEDE